MKVTRVLAVVAAVAVAAVIALGGDDGYVVRVPLANASGLKDGSAVRIGGVTRGKVRLHLEQDDQLVAELSLDQKIGKDARIMVVAANFLGTKRVELDQGHPDTRPAPSGYTFDASRVTTPTDLDQVLGVFDADTRTRAKILLNEAGEAVVGRRVDISTLIGGLPGGLQDASAVLSQLKTDNATMHELVERSDRFVAEATANKADLVRMIDVLGAASATVADKRAELQETLARAPHALQTLRAATTDLALTVQDLRPAARDVTATAPLLTSTLGKVDAFREAAEPTLERATALAPDLTRLARGATPVLERAVPVARSLASLSSSMEPISDTLDHSADNVIVILENWSHAIGFRDQMGHVFRGSASFSPDAILSGIGRLTGKPLLRDKHKRRGNGPRKPVAPQVGQAPHAPQAPVKRRPLDPILELPARLPDILGLNEVLDTTQQVQSLLDYLLKP